MTYEPVDIVDQLSLDSHTPPRSISDVHLWRDALVAELEQLIADGRSIGEETWQFDHVIFLLRGGR